MSIFIKALFSIAAMVIIGLIAYWYGRNIPISEQMPIYEALRNTSSIVFGVMGAWLVIIYPEILKRANRAGTEISSEKDKSRLRQLIQPILFASIIVAIALIFSVLRPFLEQIPLFLSYAPIFRGASYAVLVLLTCLQLITLLIAIAPADALRREHSRYLHERKRTEGYRALTSKERKDKQS